MQIQWSSVDGLFFLKMNVSVILHRKRHSSKAWRYGLSWWAEKGFRPSTRFCLSISLSLTHTHTNKHTNNPSGDYPETTLNFPECMAWTMGQQDTIKKQQPIPSEIMLPFFFTFGIEGYQKDFPRYRLWKIEILKFAENKVLLHKPFPRTQSEIHKTLNRNTYN